MEKPGGNTRWTDGNQESRKDDVAAGRKADSGQPGTEEQSAQATAEIIYAGVAVTIEGLTGYPPGTEFLALSRDTEGWYLGARLGTKDRVRVRSGILTEDPRVFFRIRETGQLGYMTNTLWGGRYLGTLEKMDFWDSSLGKVEIQIKDIKSIKANRELVKEALEIELSSGEKFRGASTFNPRPLNASPGFAQLVCKECFISLDYGSNIHFDIVDDRWSVPVDVSLETPERIVRFRVENTDRVGHLSGSDHGSAAQFIYLWDDRFGSLILKVCRIGRISTAAAKGKSIATVDTLDGTRYSGTSHQYIMLGSVALALDSAKELTLIREDLSS
jgi:hypothetical protein